MWSVKQLTVEPRAYGQTWPLQTARSVQSIPDRLRNIICFWNDGTIHYGVDGDDEKSPRTALFLWPYKTWEMLSPERILLLDEHSNGIVRKLRFQGDRMVFSVRDSDTVVFSRIAANEITADVREQITRVKVENATTNNLRQLMAAADQFFLEHGVAEATYDDLVGPTKYVKSLVPIAGEDYKVLQFRQGQALSVRTSDGRVISYGP
jgi:type IV pilus assembly protein PilA